MSFGSPWLLLFLLLVPVAVGGYLWLEQRRVARASAWSRPALLPNMVGNGPGRRRHIPLALFLLGLTLLLVGFARPQRTVKEVREGATVVLALDMSGSMNAKDVKPSRIGAADLAITQFIQKLPAKYRASLVTFSETVAVRVPPTYDRNQIVAALPRHAEVAGTALGDGLATSVLVARKAIGLQKPGVPRPPAAIVLISDGTQNAGRIPYLQAAQEARKAGIPVSTVSLGTPGGELDTPLPNGQGVQRQAVPPTPAALMQIARVTGGRFFAARSADELTQVYKDLGSHMVKQNQKQEATWIAVTAALIAIVVAIVLSGLWFRRIV